MDKSERCHTENHDVPLPEPEHITTQRQTLPDAFAAGKLVRPERFELPTYSSGGCRSIQLSYGRAADSSSVHCLARASQWPRGSRHSPRDAACRVSCMLHRGRRGKPRLYESFNDDQPSTAAIEPLLRLF